MILVFGGTTEGRVAAQVCDQSGKEFYYSTFSDMQDVPMRHGKRLVGAMTSDDIIRFCKDRGVRLIVDASHPFAEALHRSVAASGMPVVRYQRRYDVSNQSSRDIVWCSSYDELVDQLNHSGPRRLLALSGVNTIGKLKDYWRSHETFFRILPRQESLARAAAWGFPESKLVFYNPSGALPTFEEELALMREVRCDAIVTKESGDSGGFEAKVWAASELGLQIFVLKAPNYLDYFSCKDCCQTVAGMHGLRRAIERAVPDFFPLHTGLTTGTVATAAVKAATLALMEGVEYDEVDVELPDSEVITVAVDSVRTVEEGGHRWAEASVLKDFSDDPDVTRGCRITARVELIPGRHEGIRFLRGEGVGVVTLPGLGLKVGEAAINPVPRRMMSEIVKSISDMDANISVFVENGREIARRTFNERVGVRDGISIIGTSGIVYPLSNEAFIESIGRELQVARAIGCDAVGLVSGKQGEDALRADNPELRVVHYGNFIGDALRRCESLGFRRVTVGIMIGKAVKLAEGHLNTHSHQVTMNKTFLTRVAASAGVEHAEAIVNKITLARELWELMPPAFFESLRSLCLMHCRQVFPSGELEVKLIKNR